MDPDTPKTPRGGGSSRPPMIDLNRQERMGLGVLLLLLFLGVGVRLLGGGPAPVDWSGGEGDAVALQEDTRVEVDRARIRSTPMEAGERLDVNTASVDELQRLPHVGPVLARRIVEDREARGDFRMLADLGRVSGIGPKVLDAVRLHVTLPDIGSGRTASLERIDINHASAAELERLPGVGPVLAARIVEHRERHGPFTTAASLEAVSGIGPALRARIEPFVGLPP